MGKRWDISKVLSPSADSPEMSGESAGLEAGAMGALKGTWGNRRKSEGEKGKWYA